MTWIRIIQPVVQVWISIVFLFSAHAAVAQTQADKTEIRSLINEWNRAHTSRNHAAFNSVFADTVVYNLQTLAADECIAQKENFFRQFPDYRQKITSEINYSLFPGSLIKCEFTKEVIKDSVLWRYPAYLLIVREDRGYRIAGESDDDTGRALNLYLNRQKRNVERANLERDSNKQSVVNAVPDEETDSAVAIRSEETLSNREVADSGYSTAAEDSAGIASNKKTLPVTSDDTVEVPVQYIYVFIGILIVGSLFALLTGARAAKRRPVNSGNGRGKNKVKHDHSDREQSAIFEKFVIMLFDPLYFKAFRVKDKRVLAQGSPETDDFPELEFEFSHKENRATFVVESMYIPQLHYQDIQIATRDKVRAYRQLDEDDNDLYLVLGIDGKPDDPKEIYLIPVTEITQPFITYPQLQRFRKYGMFFYNAESGRLQ
jgi:hypothetical protein